MSNPRFSIANESITVTMPGGKSHVVRSTDPNYKALRKALIEEDWDAVPKFLEKGKTVAAWLGDDFEYVNRKITYQGSPLPDGLSKRMVQMAEKGDNPGFLQKFWRRLMRNPSYRSVNQLWAFIDQGGIPIDPQGYILAYKGVRADYKDCHSGTFDNRPGNEHEMPRNRISDDPRVACHVGFHVGAIGYARSFGAKTVICRVDPADVVCVPYDSSQQKMRVCRYKVVGHLGDKMPDTVIEKEDLPPELDAPVERVPVEADVSEAGQVTGGKEPIDLALEDAKAVTDNWGSFDNLSRADLEKENLGDLRKYAGKVLNIPRASKIPGGKPALLDAIDKARKAAGVSDEDIVAGNEELTAEGVPGLPPAPEPEPPAPAPEHAAYDFDSLTLDELEAKSLGDLRKYARHFLHIVGASKIKGGKPALMERIKDVRGEE